MRREEATGIHPAYLIEVHDCEPSVTLEEAQEASKRIYCPPGKVMVACHKARQKIGLLWLPDEFADQFKADMATVLAAGEGVDLSPGDTVVTDWQLGKRIRGLEACGFRTDAEIRVYGVCGGTELDTDEGCSALPVRLQDWSEGVCMRLNGGTFEATGENIVCKLPPLEEKSEGGVIMATTAQRRSCVWPVVSIGPRVPEEDRARLEGKKVCAHSGDLRVVVTDDGVEYVVLHFRDPVYFVVG